MINNNKSKSLLYIFSVLLASTIILLLTRNTEFSRLGGVLIFSGMFVFMIRTPKFFDEWIKELVSRDIMRNSYFNLIPIALIIGGILIVEILY